jgi:hypothetical protein
VLLKAAWCGGVRLRVAQFLANLWQGRLRCGEPVLPQPLHGVESSRDLALRLAGSPIHPLRVMRAGQ